MDSFNSSNSYREPWNKGKLVGQKAPFKLREIWAIRVRLQISNRTRDLALFNLAIDSKLRACDLVKLRVRDVSHGDRIAARAIVMQQKTQRPVQFEMTDQTREAVASSTVIAARHSPTLRQEQAGIGRPCKAGIYGRPAPSFYCRPASSRIDGGAIAMQSSAD